MRLTKHVHLITFLAETRTPSRCGARRSIGESINSRRDGAGRLSIADEIYKTTVPPSDGAISFQALVSGGFAASSRCRYRIVLDRLRDRRGTARDPRGAATGSITLGLASGRLSGLPVSMQRY